MQRNELTSDTQSISLSTIEELCERRTQLIKDQLALVRLREANETIWFTLHRSNYCHSKEQSRRELENLSNQYHGDASLGYLSSTKPETTLAFHKGILSDLKLVKAQLKAVENLMERKLKEEQKSEKVSVTQYGTFSDKKPFRMDSQPRNGIKPPKQRRV